ncbi:DNA-binding PadR family transcriptional regulator [Pullulanibacillus pueri]|uniref:PadR family transcriptional regulator n=1 Tax=Pullulanibacillus pueri TaxID=1437324 RepID=A0A8J2ZZX7_9BACL|nr:PadR family transcriptional regulator [Pullulanibacillus pueri]MBM7684044.1 DNA-binding PadR family transcriptional regulator [Pullulanibacillus pueri]GGH88471.1 PadR family transcriptional regulator [Pullulanibacillus pueri]
MDREIMKGSIDILLLVIISKKEMYGYEMVKELKALSNDLYQMGEGTLYPALKRLERKSLITSFWVDSENGKRRKYYRITDEGRRECDRKVQDWQSVNQLILRSMEGLT